jgi:hypothetical protein
MSDAQIPIDFDKAVTLLRDATTAIGGDLPRALDVVLRHAVRGRRPVAVKLDAIAAAGISAQHFLKAQNEMRAGLDHIWKVTNALALSEREVDEIAPTSNGTD